MCNSISHCQRGGGGARRGADDMAGLCVCVCVGGRGVCVRGIGGWGGLLYLESLLMTRMSAPFSSFSLWLSAFKSGSVCKERETEREKV